MAHKAPNPPPPVGSRPPPPPNPPHVGLPLTPQPAARDRQVGGSHYASKAVQPWDAMAAWMTPEQFAGFLRGNVIKYLARCDDKGGIEDLRKAAHYLDRLIELQADLLAKQEPA